MQLRVLGPLQVQTDAGELRLPKGPKQRLLLSALLVHAPRVVSGDRLIDLVWGDELPVDPLASLRTQTSRLRGFLKDVGARPDTLQSEPHGYRVAIDPLDLDRDRFEALLARARDTASVEVELGVLDEALALWAGRPYEEFADLPWFAPEVARLEELRTTAWERRVECLLALRRTSEAIAAIEPLVHRDPLRERPCALHMEALYRAGRQPEALSAFQQHRRRLSDELGLEPSPALTRLQAEILRHERAHARGDDGAPAPPVVEAHARLPLPLTRLIGRDDEQASVARLLRAMRLLTLTGVGGSGKTRLALEVAHQLQREGDLEVVWVALDALTDPGWVAAEVAAALGIREHPGRAATQALCDVLARRTLLLVLDNCEHLLEACAVLATSLLRAAPGVTILATSREPLGVEGEATWPVPPLRLPPGDAGEPAALAGYDAVALFVERARAASPSFALDAANAPSVARVCRHLDGMPLCLELAGALVRVLTPAEIAVRLEDDLDVLSSGSRIARPRHQTLRAAIDWSYALLTEPERHLLERLSVFTGGFDLPAVEAVCADGETIARETVLPRLTALVDKSLVVSQPHGAAARYRLLETLRTYAWQRHLVRGDRAPLRRRHADHFAGLAEAVEPDLLSARRAVAVQRLSTEQENLRGALGAALADPAAVTAAYRITGALWWYWHATGRFGEARRWAEATLAVDAAEVTPRQRARTRFTAAMACWLVGDPVTSCAHADDAIRLARELDEPALLMRALSARVWPRRDLGEHAVAVAAADEGVELARRAALPAADLGFALWIQFSACYTAGQRDRARAAAVEARALWSATGDAWGLSMILHGLALIELELDALDAAAGLCREAVAVLRREGEPHFIARSIEGLATVRVRQGEAGDAARLLGAAEAIREAIGAPLLPFEQPRHAATVTAVEAALAPPVRDALWEEGRAMGLPQVIAFVTGPAA